MVCSLFSGLDDDDDKLSTIFLFETLFQSPEETRVGVLVFCFFGNPDLDTKDGTFLPFNTFFESLYIVLTSLARSHTMITLASILI